MKVLMDLIALSLLSSVIASTVDFLKEFEKFKVNFTLSSEKILKTFVF